MPCIRHKAAGANTCRPRLGAGRSFETIAKRSAVRAKELSGMLNDRPGGPQRISPCPPQKRKQGMSDALPRTKPLSLMPGAKFRNAR
jgi:hypothetical protein